VVEYDVPDRTGNGTGELVVLLTTLTDPTDAHGEELAAADHPRWEQETANDQVGVPPASKRPHLPHWVCVLVR
jgi:hypothetical protein